MGKRNLKTDILRRYNMKKLLAFFIAVVLAFSLVGCGSSPKQSVGYATDAYIPEPMEAPQMEENRVAFDSLTAEEAKSTSTEQSASSRKRIRTFDLEVETLEYENFLAALKQEVLRCSGYIESSNVSGNSYNYTSNRYASFVCRIPSQNVDSFIGTVDGLGNITYKTENETDVTLNYVDTEARISSLKTEYDRLLELLSEAENIDTLIMLESRLTDVRYQLESYESQLRTYDNLIDYSTVTIGVNEVKRTTPVEAKTVWEQIGSEFSDNVYDIWQDLQDIFVWFVSNIPYFFIWGIIIFIIVLIVKRILRNNKQYQIKKAYRKAQKEKKKAEKLAKKNGEKIAEEPSTEPENIEE